MQNYTFIEFLHIPSLLHTIVVTQVWPLTLSLSLSVVTCMWHFLSCLALVGCDFFVHSHLCLHTQCSGMIQFIRTNSLTSGAFEPAKTNNPYVDPAIKVSMLSRCCGMHHQKEAMRAHPLNQPSEFGMPRFIDIIFSQNRLWVQSVTSVKAPTIVAPQL